MLKKLIKPAIASVALAASAMLIAAPASAGTWQKSVNVSKPLKVSKTNKWQQTPKQVRRMKRRAIKTCLAQLEYDALAAGYKDVHVKNFTAKHVGPHRFKIYTQAKVYNGFTYQFDNYDCIVRKNQVVRKTYVQLANAKKKHFRRKFEGHGLHTAAFGGLMKKRPHGPWS